MNSQAASGAFDPLYRTTPLGLTEVAWPAGPFGRGATPKLMPAAWWVGTSHEPLASIAAWPFSKTLTALAVTGVVISAIYGLRAAARVFFGAPTAQFAKVAAERPPQDLSWCEKIPALILLAALLTLGFWPKSITTSLNATLAPTQVVAK